MHRRGAAEAPRNHDARAFDGPDARRTVASVAGHLGVNQGYPVSMRFLHAWLLASATAAVLVHSGVATDPFSIVFVSIAAAIAALVAVRFAVLAVRYREMASGVRARAHRQALGRMPAPQHPRTAGRPRPRAPALSIPVT